MERLGPALTPVLKDVVLFCEATSGLKLRFYQEEAARAIVDSVAYKKGLSFVVVFPRQSGKNELQAQIETYVMVTLNEFDTEIVKASPTWKPQTQNAMRRLERVLSRNQITNRRWAKESGYITAQSSITFLSGGPQAMVGRRLRITGCDGAWDVRWTNGTRLRQWRLRPMPCVFWGDGLDGRACWETSCRQPGQLALDSAAYLCALRRQGSTGGAGIWPVRRRTGAPS
jgi:hypothetical protein